MVLKKKEKKINILTEGGIQKKLYGYLLDKDEQQDVQGSGEKAKAAEQKQVKGNTEDKEPASTKKTIQSSYKMGQLKNTSKERSVELKKPGFFKHRRGWGVLLVLVVVVALFVMFSKNRKTSSVSGILSGTQRVVSDKVDTTDAERPFYTIQVCVYEKETDAQQLVKELKQKRLSAYIYLDKYKTKAKYRVYVGKFSSEKNALTTLESVKGMFKDSFVRLVK